MKLTTFRKLYILIGLGVLAGQCTADNLYIEDYTAVPEQLQIQETTGIKLENYIVESEVSINVKISQSGFYRLKIKDISGKTVSQERVEVVEGDNILKMYVKSLPVSSYSVHLQTDEGQEIGSQLFSIQN